MLAKKTFELNPHHPVIKELLAKVKAAQGGGEVAEEVAEYADLLYYGALLNSGFLIENPTDMTTPLQKLLKVGFGIKKDAAIEEIDVDISSIEEEEEVAEEPDVEGEVEVESDTEAAEEEATTSTAGSDEL